MMRTLLIVFQFIVLYIIYRVSVYSVLSKNLMLNDVNDIK